MAWGQDFALISTLLIDKLWLDEKQLLEARSQPKL